MGKSVVRKKSIDIKGTLSIVGNEDDAKNIYIECEDSDDPLVLADLIKSFDGCEVTISVKESIDGM